ncbi:tetratricopeptide repeat protein [Actinoplanes bogorensis]|uniref:Tetratricopeptide repeat protein n=1 Tax=Paractinoplanes bogorensis TaxID=1610840 RepID=A0ABS5YIZ7_9ACTN|nr:BTAD domain-containing putative transcriptional regulator [Actinoplanes bogorensis]MBU2663440.1 tetratricopeptide repeat protein [Actinoplanes bogorensis]
MDESGAQFRVLGPVEIRYGGRLLGPPVRPQQHLVLAALLVDAGRPVPVERLIERVWGDEPPAQARRTLHTHVTRIRRLLDQTRTDLVRHDGAYRIDADPLQVDLHRFEQLIALAREAGDAAERAARWRAALDLWRGEPLSGLTGSWAERTRERLRLNVVEATVGWADASVRCGRPAEVIDALARVVDDFPLSEPPVEVLMRALAADGRTSEALDRYETTRRRLADELGTSPGSDLSALHVSLLREAAEPAHLPGAVRGFVGRTEHLTWLDDVARRGRDAGIGTTVVVLPGMPGVGKTTLAVHWAHRVRRMYPDGQLFAGLRGFHPTAPPVDPAEAVGGLLETLGVSRASIPAGLDARTALYRGMLADRRMLVLLDDAASVDQVRPLLPAGSGSLVLVTSRRRLDGLVVAQGAHRLAVEPFSTDDGTALLSERLGVRPVAREPEAARDITAACSGLPLALAIAAAHAGTRPLRVLADELREARDALGVLATDDPAVDVRTVFWCSYRALGAGAARLFRLLSLHPGADIGLAAAASLAGEPPELVRQRLAELTRAHMIAESTPGRWSAHDLLRAYGMEMLADDDRDAALDRLLNHYVLAAADADGKLGPVRRALDLPMTAVGVTRAPIGGDLGARAWFDAEWPALHPLVVAASESGRHRPAWQLAWSLTTYAHRRGSYQEWLAVQRIAIEAAAALGDRAAGAHARRLLGIALIRLNRYDEAHAELTVALDEFTALGDPQGQAQAHRGLGRVAAYRNELRVALTHGRAALEGFTAAGNRDGRASALNSLGFNLAKLGEHAEGVRLCRQALEIHQESGDRFGQANAWDSLGLCHVGLGDFDEAFACYMTSLALSQEIEDRHGEASTLDNMGHAYRAFGREEDARRVWRQAVTLLRTVDPLAAQRLDAELAQ